MRQQLLWMFCVLNLYAAPDYESGIFEIHYSPILAMSGHYMEKKSIGFLVDRKAGVVMSVGNPNRWCEVPFVGRIDLAGKGGRVMRGCCIQRGFGIVLIQIVEEDRAFLSQCYEFRTKRQVKLGDPVRYFPKIGMPIWRRSNIADRSVFNEDYPLLRFRMPKRDVTVPMGVPILSKDRGEIVGVVSEARRNLLIYPGTLIHFHLEYFKKHGSLFPAHLGVSYLLEFKDYVEFYSGKTFNPPHYDMNKTLDNRLVLVGEMDRLEGKVLTNLRAFDVIVSINNTPIYTEEDVWESLHAAYVKGLKTVRVCVWRFGDLVDEVVPLYESHTRPVQQVYRYGSCTFYQACSVLDKNVQGVAVMMDGEEQKGKCFFVEKINAHPISQLQDVVDVLSQHPDGGVFMHMRLVCEKSPQMPGYKSLHYVSRSKALGSVLYVADPVWRKKC